MGASNSKGSRGFLPFSQRNLAESRDMEFGLALQLSFSIGPHSSRDMEFKRMQENKKKFKTSMEERCKINNKYYWAKNFIMKYKLFNLLNLIN